MKIKHFAGYGSVNAEKIKMERAGNGVTVLHVRVTGDHEYGLKRDSRDTYGLYNWLVKRFDKSLKDAVDFDKRYPVIQIKPGYNAETKQEFCDYVFAY